MKLWWLALGFLTVLPVPAVGAVPAARFRISRVLYPAVGMLIGLLVALTAWGCRALGLPDGVGAALTLGVGFLATGFLHLDGLLDCADALLAPVPPTRRLEILKDVHFGSFAFGTGALFLLTEWQLIAARPSLGLLMAVPMFSRASVILLMTLWPYARREGGIPAASPWQSLREGLPVLVGALLCVLPAAALFPAAALGVLVMQLLFAVWASRRLDGGLTGDCYGAAILLSELAGLLAG